MIQLKATIDDDEYDIGINMHDISCVVPAPGGVGAHVYMISDPQNPIDVDNTTTEVIEKISSEESYGE